MASKEELQETYSKLTNDKLMEILDNKHEYTDTAVIAALEEISKRKLTEGDIKLYKEKQVEETKSFIRKYVFDDLSFWQKNIFYFVKIPFFISAIKTNLDEDGYILKLHQSNYYSFMGWLMLILSVILSLNYNWSTLTTLAIWIGGFVIAHAFDITFNRQRQIKRLKQLFGENKHSDENED